MLLFYQLEKKNFHFSILNFLRKKNYKIFNEMKKIMKFDEGNKIFLKLIKELNI